MAVQVFQKKPEIKGSRGKKGGGKFGSLGGAALGATLGIAAAPATGGASLAAAGLGGAAGGASLGGLLGGVVAPGKADTRQAIQRRVTGIQQSAGGSDPQDTMKQAILAMREINNPELTQQYAPLLAQGMISTLPDRGTA
jgi:hypothetical protein